MLRAQWTSMAEQYDRICDSDGRSIMKGAAATALAADSSLLWQLYLYFHLTIHVSWNLQSYVVFMNGNFINYLYLKRKSCWKPSFIYYYKIKSFLHLVSKSGPYFELIFFCSSGVFFPPAVLFRPRWYFLPRASWEKIPPGSKNGQREEKTSLWTEKRVRKGPLFSTRHEITNKKLLICFRLSMYISWKVLFTLPIQF